jgi:arylsulfatase A-like enzyme/predicted Zn-dependent protease
MAAARPPRRSFGRPLALVAAAIVAVLVAVAASGVAAPWYYALMMRRPPASLDVLLITLDTTRADHLGAYGRSAATTPHLDALARGGVRFSQAFSHVPLTFPSHSSLMSGLLPTRHGMRDNGTTILPPTVALLAERFRAAGYRTGAFVSAFVLDRRFGLDRGFDTYGDDVPGTDAAVGGDPSERSVRAAETVDRALAWLGANDARPRFLWVHLFDPHAPYDPPEPFRSQHAGRPYDGEIAYMDAQIGRLLEAAHGAGRSWLTVVAGDHGEGLGDHDELTHGYYVYGNTQRVPLLMHLPGRVPAAAEVPAVVGLVDVAPTMLELSGLPALDGADGRSLVDRIAGRTVAPGAPVYMESYHPRDWWGAQEITALRTAEWLFVEAPRPELYDAVADPGERTNLAPSRRQVVAELRQTLKTFAAGSGPDAERAPLDAAAEARLRSLGYLGGSRPVEVVPGTALPDAKDNGPLLAAITEGHELVVRGQHAAALERFRAALAANPRSVTARSRVGETLLALGRHDEAFATFGDLAASGAAPESAYLGMAQARQAKGDLAAALAVARAGLEAVPASAALLTRAGDLLLAGKSWAEAEQSYRRALATAPRDEAARYGLAMALAGQGRQGEAIEEMLTLAENTPRAPQVRRVVPTLLSWADERLGARAPAEARRAYEAALATGVARPEIFSNLALATWQLGQRDAALAVIDRGVAQFPESTELLYRRGRVLQDLGRRDDALAAFRAVIALAPGHPQATAAIAAIERR